MKRRTLFKFVATFGCGTGWWCPDFSYYYAETLLRYKRLLNVEPVENELAK